jgi:hypothetical protein
MGCFDMVECYKCGSTIKDIHTTAEKVLCWQCCIDNYWDRTEVVSKKLSDKPRGWKFMSVYVHKDGTVYHKGVEQPDLKGTLPPTKIKPKQKATKKLTKKESNDLVAELGTLKASLRRVKTKKAQATIEKKIKAINKKLR